MPKKKDYYQVSLKLILKNNQGEILGLKADSKGSMAGYYDLPGGRIDTDEFKKPLDQIIKREVAEETGNLEFELVPKPVAVGRHLIPAAMTSEKKDIHVCYIFYEAKYLNGNVKISCEHTGCTWLKLSTDHLDRLFTSGILEGMKMYLSEVYETDRNPK